MRSALHKKFLPPSGRGVAPDSLLTDLLAYWPLDEQSGFRYNATDPTAFSAKFVSGNSESLSHVDNVDLSITGDKSFAAWVKLDDLAANYGIIEKRTAADEYQCLARAGTGKLNVYIADSVAGYSEILNTTDGLVAGRWHLIIWWYDSADKKVRAQIDLGAIDAGAALANGPKDSNSLFELGALASAGFFLNGMMSRVGIWNKVLSAPERTELYNSGRGKLFSQLSAGIQVGLVSYWNLGELSGNRADSFGANTLTDNNTVGADFDYPGILKLTDNNTVTYVNDGPRGVSAKFVSANSEKLTGLTYGGRNTFTLTAWIKNSAGTTPGIWFYGDFTLDYSAANDRVVFRFLKNDLSYIQVNHGTISADDQWHFVVCEYDAVADTIDVWVDGIASPGSASIAAAVGFGIVTSELGISVGGTFDNGMISRVGLWSKALSIPEINALYRQGIGKRYSDLGPPEKVNLVSYWNLDELSGNRADSHGANTLNDNNTVMNYVNGPEANVAKFVALNNESLSIALADSIFDGSKDITLNTWVKADPSVTQYVFGHGSAGAATAFDCYMSASNFNARMYDGVSAVQAQVGATPNNWYMLTIQWRIASKKIRMKLMGSDWPASENIWNESPALAGNAANTGVLYIGAGNAVPETFLTGNLSRFGVWSRELSDLEITALFNLGSGKAYSELVASEKVDLVSYWNLTELSGNRADSHGANTLTDNNTVMSVINMPDVANNIAAKFVSANSEKLTYASPGLISGFGSFTIAGWFYFDPADLPSFFSHDTNEFFARIDNGGVSFHVQAWDLGANYSFISSPHGLTGASWRFVWFGFDDAANKVHGGINNVAYTPDPSTYNIGFTAQLSEFGFSLQDGIYLNGMADEIGFWSRVLTPAEITRLFNLGKGYFYPFVP